CSRGPLRLAAAHFDYW
nr:immunoglobulin heavy chain junction region [Macaca mulatta]MPN84340.1 immunoglobulin heavy chain junction region [Macaca mulatta]MPN84399.1 immunoglobulin heavy chain junction region [Macaca mulatta]MPN84451.1 immunoglobulin heavy chain junction region [Macaca mulatta]MPN84574.1 immunoglobulin heavy chain junction region [Macaca mulatta]